MESHTPAVYALTKLHAELGGKISDNKREAIKLRADMKHVEAVLRLIQPDFDTRRIAVRRRYNPIPLFKRGQTFRAVLEILKAAPEPMSGDEIAMALLHSKGVAEPTRDQRRRLWGAVNGGLQKPRGKVGRGG